MRKIHLALARKHAEKRPLRTHIGGPESGSIPDMYGFDAEAKAKWQADYGDYLRFLAD